MNNEQAVTYLESKLNNPDDATEALEWFNVNLDYETNTRTDEEDKKFLEPLIKLCNDGNFETFECDCCGSFFNRGDPDNWGDFQGVCQDEGGETMINDNTKIVCEHCLAHNSLFF